MTDRKSLIAAAKELGVKKANFMKTEELVKEILRMQDLADGVSDETQAVIDELVAATEEPAAEEAVVEEPEKVYEAEPIPAQEKTEEPVAEEADLEDLTSREALNAAAIDMNEVMGLDPGIDTTLPQELFMKAFVKASELANGTDNFKDFTWQVLAANDLGPERLIKKPIKKEPAPEKEKKTKVAKPKQAGDKKPGVIATIKAFLDERFASSDASFVRDDVFKYVLERIPDRNEDSLMNTIKTQVPGKLTKNTAYRFEKLGVGKYKVIQVPSK